MMEHLSTNFDFLTLNAISLQLNRLLRNKFPVSQQIYPINNTQAIYQFDNNTYNIDQQDEGI